MPPTTTFGSGLWVPNAFVGEGNSDVCIHDKDGDLDLPVATPKFASKEDCCAGFYAWNFKECIGDVPTFKFYPNWLRAGGSGDVCLFDDGSNEVPPGTPKYDTPKECCAIHYSWNLSVCNSVEAGPSNKYFPNWIGADHVCLLDDGSHTVPQSAPLYSDLTSCCDFNYSWNLAQCNAVEGPTGKYFPNLDGDDLTCFQDNGRFKLPFADPVDNYDNADTETLPFGAPLFDDLSSCCSNYYPWARDECIDFLV
eukprot:scaffold68079_cov66-Cyclotella_meneghiniana.AAC.5